MTFFRLFVMYLWGMCWLVEIAAQARGRWCCLGNGLCDVDALIVRSEELDARGQQNGRVSGELRFWGKRTAPRLNS